MLQSTVETIERGELNAEIAVLFCNRAQGEAEATDKLLTYARDSGVPLVAESSVAFRKSLGGRRSRPGEPLPEWRGAWDEAVATALQGYYFEVGILAGYMLITTADFCLRYPLLNLHPAAPGGPKGTWQDVIRELVATGADQSGVLIHVVTPELDEGPVVAYCLFPIRGEDLNPLWAAAGGAPTSDLEDSLLSQRIRALGRRREPILLVETLKAAAAGVFQVRPSSLTAPDGSAFSPLDLSAKVEQALHSANSGTGG
jgi:folate-dependent phosphoribosylglycinamide formyltransferase PurN